MPIKFDRNLYNIYDPLAKRYMRWWLLMNNYTDINIEETYGVDITCKNKDNNDCYFELEVKSSWIDNWPDSWKEIRIPYRKRKIIDKWTREGSNGILTFVVFEKNIDYAWFIDGAVVNKCDVKPVDNRRRAAELFYHIKIADAELKIMYNCGGEDTYDEDALINSKYPN